MALDCYTIYLDLTIIHLFVNLFHAAIVKKSLKCVEKSWTMDQKIFKDAPDCEGGSHEKGKEGKWEQC